MFTPPHSGPIPDGRFLSLRLHSRFPARLFLPEVGATILQLVGRPNLCAGNRLAIVQGGFVYGEWRSIRSSGTGHTLGSLAMGGRDSFFYRNYR